MKNNRRKREVKIGKLEKLKPIYPCVAGVDVGAAELYVSVPEDRDVKPVRMFQTFTGELHRIAAWLKQCGVTSVAVESTGIYWIPLYEVLEEAGFEVRLVNAREAKNLPGRKSDVLDCQWIQQLHSYGLLGASFRPSKEIVGLRSLVRHRDRLIEGRAVHIQHMQKALRLMNVQLDNVLRDITGVTGLRIVRAIVAGQTGIRRFWRGFVILPAKTAQRSFVNAGGKLPIGAPVRSQTIAPTLRLPYRDDPGM